MLLSPGDQVAVPAVREAEGGAQEGDKVREDVRRHALLTAASFMETSICTDGDSQPFIELKFIHKTFRGDHPNTSPIHFLSKEQADVLIIDLQRKGAAL